MDALTIDTMRAIARLHGFDWSDAELEAMRPAVEANRRLLERLDSRPIDGVDPSTQYRLF